MTLTVPDIGETMLLDNALKTASPEALILRLYSNNYDPIKTSVVGSFTEVTGSGYAAKTLTRAGWGAAVPDGPSSSTYGTMQTFNWTGAATVVGYYLVGAVSGTLYWAERLYSGAGQVFGNGDALNVQPRVTFGSSVND